MFDPSSATHRRIVAEALLFGTLLLTASGQFLYMAWRNNELALLREVFLQYKAATLAVDFVDFGAVHRGLAGSLARMFTSDAVSAAIAFHFASAFVAACVLSLLFAMFRGSVVRRLAFAGVALALMTRWGEDGGRTDLAVVALLGAATVAWRSDRAVTAAVIVGLGLFMHEASFVLGVSLLAAFAWRNSVCGELTWQRIRGPLMILGAALAMYVAFAWLPHSTNVEIATRVRERVADNDAVDVALYFALAGVRGVRSAICQNALDTAAPMHIAMGGVVICITALALTPVRSVSTCMVVLVGLPGYLLLVSVANDHARWTLLACITLWLFAISAPEAARSALNRRFVIADATCLAAACVLMMALVPATHPDISRVVSPVPRVDQWLSRTPSPKRLGFADVVARCDPHRRDVLRAGPR